MWWNSVVKLWEYQCRSVFRCVGMHHHIRMLAGVSVSFFYRIIYEVIDVINQADELRIQFPATPGDRVKVAAGFRRLSSRQVIPNCIGCIDGWLCPIKVPTSISAIMSL